MTCDAVRAAMLAGDEAGWPSGVLGHLAACDHCADVAAEQSLRRAPAIAIPPTFAADVARRARLEQPPEARRTSAAAIGAGGATVVLGTALAWLGAVESRPAAVPVVALLLACSEAIVLAAWTLHGDVVRAHARR